MEKAFSLQQSAIRGAHIRKGSPPMAKRQKEGKRAEKMKDENIEKELVNVLAADDRVAAAYLFGSFLSGNFTNESDIDLGLLFCDKSADSLEKIPNALSMFDLAVDLSEMIGRTVDVVPLNNASPIICMQVLRKGKKIFERDSHLVNEFFIKVVNSYADLKMVRRPIERHILSGRLFAGKE